MDCETALRPAVTGTDIANLWTDGQWKCVLSWVGHRYRIRLMHGPAIVREEIDVDEHVVFDISLRWRVEQLFRATSA